MSTLDQMSASSSNETYGEKETPWLNRGPVIIALAVTFQAVTWVAVFFRFYARLRPTRCLSWDDLFVVLASVATTIGTVGVCLQVPYGLGKHFDELPREHWDDYLFWNYFVIPNYAAALTFIKVSILWQYLRLAEPRKFPVFRTVCWITMIVSVLWGTTYFLLMVLGCHPIDGYWKTSEPAKCILFGSRNPRQKVNGYITHAATNMILDGFIFVLPLHFFYTMEMSRKSIYGIVGVFTIGACVITIAIVRFVNLVKHRLGLIDDATERFDVTFFAVPVVIFSCLEVMVATVTASIPIFWPVFVSWKDSAILVINEVTVKSEKRQDMDMRRVDSAQALRDDWQTSNNIKMKDIDIESYSQASPRPPIQRNDSMSRTLVFPGSGTPEPGNHERLFVTETTAQRGSVRYSQYSQLDKHDSYR